MSENKKTFKGIEVGEYIYTVEKTEGSYIVDKHRVLEKSWYGLEGYTRVKIWLKGENISIRLKSQNHIDVIHYDYHRWINYIFFSNKDDAKTFLEHRIDDLNKQISYLMQEDKL